MLPANDCAYDEPGLRKDTLMSSAAAIEFPDQLEWLNAPPQTLAQARGRVALVAVVNPGSAYCQNVLEHVRRVQARYPEQVRAYVVLCPKFDAERDPRVLGQWVSRLGIGLAVACDASYAFWQAMELRSWPTVLVLDSDGRLHEMVVGDERGEVLEEAVATLLDQHDGVPLSGEAPVFSRPQPRMPLRFPVGLAIIEGSLFVADSGNHRVLECALDGRILRQFGGGNADLLDGRSGEAAFRRPAGLAQVRDALFVTDAGNHALRRISLHDGDVATVLGTGRAGSTEGGSCREGQRYPLDLPFGICAMQQRLYIANSAANQVLELDLGQRELSVLVGSGALAMGDGEARAAALAQPSGLCASGQALFCADAAASAIRSIQPSSRQVTTLVGAGLFEFGQIDGPRAQARLQYPTALATDSASSTLWIADTGNHALRCLRFGGDAVDTLALPVRLHYPMGIAVGAGYLWVANTHAHEVLRVDIATGETWHVPIGE